MQDERMKEEGMMEGGGGKKKEEGRMEGGGGKKKGEGMAGEEEREETMKD
jgi:hypothetical protein